MAAVLSWAGLSFWYGLLQWTALAFSLKCRSSSALGLTARQLYPARRRVSNRAARRSGAVMLSQAGRLATLAAFTLLGDTIGVGSSGRASQACASVTQHRGHIARRSRAGQRRSACPLDETGGIVTAEGAGGGRRGAGGARRCSR
jgi:hypothetical protein